MHRIPPNHPMAFLSTLSLVALISASGVPSPRSAAAEEIILVQPPLIRKFPAFTFCPFPVSLQFTANASTATVHMVANNYVFGPSFEGDPDEFRYAHQGVDNVSVVPLAVHTAHLLDNDLSSDYFTCYSQATVPFIFKFDEIAPGSVPLLETFENAPSGWDMTQGAYYDSRSAHNDPSSTTGHTDGVGSLGLGLSSPTPSLSDSARTSVTVTGLTAGQPYVLNGWWVVDNGIFSNDVSLTIKITGPDLTPLGQRTWGSVKRRYR
jgi:hypothetical protein